MRADAWLVGMILIAGPGDDDFFEARIRPVLVERCLGCHGPDKAKAGLRMLSRDHLLRGGDSGPTIVPGDAAESLIMAAVDHRDGLKMPPDGQLPESTRADLRAWIDSGAPWSRPIEMAGKPASAAVRPDWWAYRSPTAVELPMPGDDWPRTEIDRFVAAGLRAQGMHPAPPADKRTLIRRVTYDLTGLPPTPEEATAFLADASDSAFETVVERLLASPHYGERWGRHWLDLVRYADTAGDNSDHPAPHAWRYRNWVIDAFNRDQPYDRFVRDQVAGDLLGESRAVATGFLAVARRFGHDIDKDMHLTHEDIIDTLGRAILGQSIACARCHDHKYDPISTRDYYALAGILGSTRFPFPGCEAKQQPRDLVPMPAPAGSEPNWAYAVAEGTPQNSKIHLRGDPQQLGPEVPRRWLEVFGGEAVPAGTTSGRLELARWLTDPGNPLTARVMVNRVWLHHFGKGLVVTPNDFGTRGQPPTHPELLDWLALQFVKDGWSVKSMHRRIMRSKAYQQAVGAEFVDRDPGNAWCWRFDRRRLSAEEVRDSILAASGRLDRSAGEAHPFPPPESWNFTQHDPFGTFFETDKRSVYLVTLRNRRHPFLGLFDGADPNTSTPQRQVTTVPTQALFFLNDPWLHQQAEAIADRVLGRAEADRLPGLTSLLFQRAPTEAEGKAAEGFLNRYRDELGDVPPDQRRRAAWSALVRVLLASNEFLYVE